jgi:hypothetical protein
MSSPLEKWPLLLKRLAGVILVCSLIGSGDGYRSAACATNASSEYQVKAAFLYNFLKFVDWPTDGISSPSTIAVGILGRDPFDDALEPLNGKIAKGRRVTVLHFRSVEEARGVDLLFICASEKGRLSHILKTFHNSHVLTVGDTEGFCQAGGMINLVFIKNRVGFDVNIAAANRARLRISSQLLKLARSVLE